jgi:hypothetical protein
MLKKIGPPRQPEAAKLHRQPVKPSHTGFHPPPGYLHHTSKALGNPEATNSTVVTPFAIADEVKRRE